ncbi:uncharacterized protein DNG_09750 [Cephalotrichum gorgonifer]|uniref:Uncharacterized protein n=1 Tax=Cephalotrichum gorgonifer TaxID=2041049 RepID=A0AAE8N6A3_9PEZI|nr:uncharacterized protein DNG_09750 [Cephalotrichum gorgonifer]
MRVHLKTIAYYGIWANGVSALYQSPDPQVTAGPRGSLDARQEPEQPPLPEFEAGGAIQIAAIVPTEPGQIGINPPPAEPTYANIEIHREYYTVEDGTTKWVGPDHSFINVATTTVTQPGGETSVATITKGVSVSKNEKGGLDIVLPPAIKLKLEEIAKQVTPCPAKRRRRTVGNQKRQGAPACGLADFVQRVGGDAELQSSFAEPLTDQAWEVDSGYGSDTEDPAADPGWEGDGGPGNGGDGGSVFHDDDEGFFEGSEAGEGESTLETLVFSTEEEAAAIGAALSGAGGAEAAAVWGGSTVTAGSFLAWLWGTLKDGKALAPVQQIPSESIHTVTKTKTKSDSETTTTTTSSTCPTATDHMVPCGNECKPTSVKKDGAEATGVVDWACSEGDFKDCKCDPQYVDVITTYQIDIQQILEAASKSIDENPGAPPPPPEPRTECTNDISNAPSQFFLDQTSKDFCSEVMGNLDSSHGPTAYDIKGNKIPILRRRRLAVEKRAPPENIDNYGDYRFFLGYEKLDGECLVDAKDLCRNAYAALVGSNCGSNHGSAGNRMFADASVDVGCAKFTWKVDKALGTDPPPDMSLGKIDCHDPHSHYDVHAPIQDAWSELGCKYVEDKRMMKPGDPELYWHPVGMGTDYHQNFKISWIEGCTKVQEQDTQFPVAADQSATCAKIMNANYHECRDNGGAGGVVDVGCLRYDFYVTGS